MQANPRKANLRSRRSAPLMRHNRLEGLERRELFSLLGVVPAFPSITYDAGGSIAYTASTGAVSVNCNPLIYTQDGVSFPLTVDPPRGLQINFTVSPTGTLVGGVPGDDLVVTGNIDTDFDSIPDYSGVLLTGEIVAFGFQDLGAVDQYDYVFNLTGGALASQFAGHQIGIFMTSEHSTFSGSFTTDFGGGAKGTLGTTDFGGAVPGSISGHKFQDITGNGISGDDAPLGGTTIQLYRDVNNDQALTAADGAPIGTATTSAGGTYSFGSLQAGNYLVSEVVAPGYTRTAPGGGVYAVTLSNGQNSTGNDFANFKNIVITGTKFYDANANGLHDDNAVVVGWSVFLDTDNDPTNGFIAVTVTDANGNYTFGDIDNADGDNNGLTGSDLGPGTYKVYEGAAPSASGCGWSNWCHSSCNPCGGGSAGGWIQTYGIGGYIIVAGARTNSGGTSAHNDFGNLKLVCGSGGVSVCEWTSCWGEAVIKDCGGVASELAMLSSLNLVKNVVRGGGCGGSTIVGVTNFDPTSYSQLKSWLQSANSTNMANALSAQLAAAELSVEAGTNHSGFLNATQYVDTGTLLLPFAGSIAGLNIVVDSKGVTHGFITVANLMAAANTELGKDMLTLSGDVNRPIEAALRTALDRLNNDQLLFVLKVNTSITV